MKVVQGSSDVNPIGTQFELPNSVLMTAATAFDGGDGLAYFAMSFEVAQEQDIVGEIADVDRALQRGANGTGLSQNHDREHAAISQIGQQFVQMHGQELLPGHRLKIAVQTVEKDETNVFALNMLLHVRNQFSGDISAGSMRSITILPL